MMMMLILGALAAFILFQLYNVLGRKVGFKSDDQPVSQNQETLEETTLRLEKKPEPAIKITNLDQLKVKDQAFNETTFLIKARETYEAVVRAFHDGNLEPVKDQLNTWVLQTFKDAIETRPSGPAQSVSFVEPPRADYDSIEVKDDVASIRMRFLSELAYETKPEPESEGLDRPASAAAKLLRRTAEYWTFERSFKNNNQNWLLSKVEKAMA